MKRCSSRPLLALFSAAVFACAVGCAQLQTEGVTGLFYVPGDDLLGYDGEGATDGSHPNDLGFMRQAAIFEPVLRAPLEGR